jgi:hypothetical protein
MEQNKPKRVYSEERLAKLAEARKKALEVKAKLGEISRVKKQAKKEQREREYKDVVLKKVKPPVEYVDEGESDTEEPKRQVSSQPNPEPNFKQMYYKTKLERLANEDQRQAQLHAYSQAPMMTHAYDIARDSLKAKANAAVLKHAYRNIFPMD